MTGPLAQQFAQVREARDWIWRQAENDAPPHGWKQREELIERFDAALSVIERHVQDMASVLDEIWMKPYRAEEIMLRYRDKKS